WVYRNISIPLIRCATKLEERGVYIDQEHFSKLCRYYKDTLATRKAELNEKVGRELKSPTYYQNVQNLLFKELGLPLTAQATKSARKECNQCRKTYSPCSPAHASTSADDLTELNDRTPHPVVPLIIDIKQLEKTYSTQLDGGGDKGFRQHIREDGRIHARWSAARAGTGRFACVPLDAEILTMEGWKHVEDLELEESVVGYDMTTESLQPTPLEDIHREYASVGSIQFQNTSTERGYHVRCTAEHRWVVKTPRIRAGLSFARNLSNKGDLYVQQSAPAGFSGKAPISPTEAGIIGWAITDGTRITTSAGRCALQIIVKKPSSIKALDELLQDVTHSRTETPQDTVRYYLGVEVYDALVSLTEPNNLPYIIMTLSVEAREAMWNAMMEADGCPRRYYSTKSERFGAQKQAVSDAFSALAVLMGKTLSYRARPETGFIDWHIWQRDYSRARWVPPIAQAPQEPVWCPKTGTRTWVMRLDGRVLITGNCEYPNLMN
ncbi:hypothetical protein LCGC14_2515850, partial [marine sediment metagenome]